MKKRIVVTFAILMGCYGLSNAQGSPFSVGLSIGPNITRLNTKDEIQSIFKPGNRLFSSANVEYKITQRLFVQADIAYELKGVKMPHMIFVDSLGNTTGEVTLHLNYGYISLPVLLNYKFTTQVAGQNCGVVIGAGVYGGLLVNRTERIKGYNVKDSLLHSGIVYDDKVDFGLSLNAALEYPVSKRITINPRVLLNYGIHNIIDKPQFNNIHPGYNVSRNVALNFLIGAKYNLPPKKKRTIDQ